MGLPKININFFSNLKPRAKRNPSGVVALILKDDTQTEGVVIYKPGEEITGWSSENLEYINLAFEGGPREVIVAREDKEAVDYSTALNGLKNKRFNYLAIPQIDELETDAIVAWIKEMRNKNRKSFKAILPHTEGDYEGVLNWTAEEIVANGKEYTTAEYTARVAGAAAGLPFNRSLTYYVFPEVESFKEKDNPDESVENGELFLIDDGEKIKIGRGVNSLTTINPEEKKNDTFKSVRAIHIMDMIRDEIYTKFADHYVGKVPNIYDNQVLFINEAKKGFTDLEDLELLDGNHENTVFIDVDAQRKAWEDAGMDTTDWDDQKVKENAFRRNVFLAGKIRVVDTAEDLDFSIEV